jgi:hypothetical protein
MNTLLPGTRLATFPLVLLFAGLFGGCATISTGSHFDETVNFGAYESFSWIADEPLISMESSIPVSALAQSMIKTAIQGELQNKGYAFTDDRATADFVIGYTIGTREHISIDSYPTHYRGRWGWHVPYSYYYYNEVSAHSYTKGTLGVDVFDNESGKPVWHGWAEKTVSQRDRADPGPAIDEGVRMLFESFPH